MKSGALCGRPRWRFQWLGESVCWSGRWRVSAARLLGPRHLPVTSSRDLTRHREVFLLVGESFAAIPDPAVLDVLADKPRHKIDSQRRWLLTRRRV